MPKQERKAPKGLPKRFNNTSAKARRARSWARGQVRKELRRQANAVAASANRKRIVLGEPSARDIRRAARPFVLAFAHELRRPTRQLPAMGAALLRHARTIMDSGAELPFYYRYSNLSEIV